MVEIVDNLFESHAQKLKNSGRTLNFLVLRAVVDVVRNTNADPDSEITKSLKRITELVAKYKDDDPTLTQDAA